MKKIIFNCLLLAAIVSCNGVADHASETNSDTVSGKNAEPAPVPASDTATATAAAEPETTAPPVSVNGEEDRVKILTNIDSYLIPKATYKSDHNGIQDATVTLENTLDVTFQKVFLEVKYIAADGIENRTDFLTFQNIEAGDIKTQKLANVLRATVIQCKVVKLKCEKLTRGEMILVGERFKNL